MPASQSGISQSGCRLDCPSPPPHLLLGVGQVEVVDAQHHRPDARPLGELLEELHDGGFAAALGRTQAHHQRAAR